MPWRNEEEPRRFRQATGFAVALLLHIGVIWGLVAYSLVRKPVGPPLRTVEVSLVAGARSEEERSSPVPEAPAPPAAQPPPAAKPAAPPPHPATVRKAPALPAREAAPAPAPPVSAPAGATGPTATSGTTSAPNDASAAGPASPQLDPGRPNPRPPYPPASRRLREQGTVVLLLHVTASGDVDEARVDRSSGFPRLDRAALKEAPNWHFIPAARAGASVAAWHRYSVTFVLTDE